MELKPAQLPVPDVKPVQELCKKYIDDLADGRVDDDLEHYIFEAAMEMVYGKDVWAWINVRFR